MIQPISTSKHEPTVFAIDDYPASLHAIGQLLDSMHIACERFTSAEDYLEDFDPQRRGCVVCDIRLEGMSGLELQSQLNEIEPSPPVILISGFADVSTAVEAVRNGAVTLLEKPLAVTDLERSVREAFQQDDVRWARRRQLIEIQNRINQLSPDEQGFLQQLIGGLEDRSRLESLVFDTSKSDSESLNALKETGAESVAQLVRLIVEMDCPSCPMT